jgi:phage terminase small subunit
MRVDKQKPEKSEKESTYKALKPRERVFVDAYLETNNATEAARRCGYKESSAYQLGWRLLRKVEVKEAINEVLDSRALTAEKVLAILSEQSTASIADFFVINTDGTVGDIDTAYLKKHGYLVKKIKIDTGKIELELYDGQNATVQLGRYHALFKDNSRFSGADGGPIQTQEVKATPEEIQAAIDKAARELAEQERRAEKPE